MQLGQHMFSQVYIVARTTVGFRAAFVVNVATTAQQEGLCKAVMTSEYWCKLALYTLCDSDSREEWLS